MALKYIATGRLHPERSDIRFGPIVWSIPEQGRVVAQCEASQLSILIELSTVDGFVTAYIAAEQFAHIAVGALGFALGSGYSVELIQVTEEDVTPHVFGVRPTGATPSETLAFSPHDSTFNQAFQLANRDIFFRLALRDYLRAFTDAIDCGMYCYRAIESLKSSFEATGVRDGWGEVHSALGTDRALIESTIKAFADPIRHGNWIAARTSTANDRWQMLRLTRAILSKYLEHMQPTS